MPKTPEPVEIPQIAPQVLRTDDAALYVGLRPGTLEKNRRSGDGPPFVRLGPRAIGYLVRDLDEWIATRERSRRRGD